MRTKNKFLLSGLLLSSVLFIGAKGDRKMSCKNPVLISTETQLAKSGIHYTIIYQENSRAGFTVSRPSRKDSSIYLCIPAAFTITDDNTVDGVYIVDGKISSPVKVNKRVGGGVKIVNGKCSLMPTAKGALLTDSLLQAIAAAKGSFFQQIMLIEKGVVPSFKDSALFQRRAIVTMKNGKTAVIESYEHIRLARFSSDLVELGVQDAVYTDMGAWDEGWYRDPKNCKLVSIGRMKMQTSRQSNWFVFKR